MRLCYRYYISKRGNCICSSSLRILIGSAVYCVISKSPRSVKIRVSRTAKFTSDSIGHHHPQMTSSKLSTMFSPQNLKNSLCDYGLASPDVKVLTVVRICTFSSLHPYWWHSQKSMGIYWQAQHRSEPSSKRHRAGPPRFVYRSFHVTETATLLNDIILLLRVPLSTGIIMI